MVAVVTAAAVLVGGCGSSVRGGSLTDQVNPIDLDGQSYTVGGKDSDDHLLLCEIAVATLLSVDAQVEERCGLGDAEANRQALLRGDIDLYWENIGTAWTTFLGQDIVPGPSPQYRALQERDLAENEIVWLEPTLFGDTDTFAVSSARAGELGLERLSDMAEHVRSGEPGNLCIEPGYADRAFGLAGLGQAYDVQIPAERVRTHDSAAIYQLTAANPEECLFGQVTAGDPRTAEFELTVLRDDQQYHVPNNASVAIRQDAYDPNPDVARAFAAVAKRLTNDVMAELRHQMRAEEMSAREVARTWLRDRGFIAGGH